MKPTEWRSYDADGNLEAVYVGDEAARINQACNSHDDLVAALESMYALHTGEHGDTYQEALTKALNKAEAALDIAKGEA